ncbi:hypothetical protein L486_01031 [Kwoniella mangroviensis CBS 10435]|uniref:Uncharacterized protein n=2 Tax=Kwoniella mangrovensis TaxID=463800 RepID=A0A1B9J0U3_9TREE|nr:uncharacterized protein I203_06042 [Kwoniella mangroviensis CBS 8507]OCF61383.1 hypothetical protein L486_01031 [Kwoniella mangroviensis CBS 10435]OCF64798.1 hypothetical protein I203_06042 [Kwoniella mangroviensis CBS 8507]OCF77402.1 hypothetical protein I204_01390 [Kwoniella mangroviensis CBS 8886]
MCYRPGPIEKPDLSEFSMVNDAEQVAEQVQSELPSTSPDQPPSAVDKIDNGIGDIKLEASDIRGSGVLGKVAA